MDDNRDIPWANNAFFAPAFLGDILTIESLGDEALVRLYENIRMQIDAERYLKHKFVSGPDVREHAGRLYQEIYRRRLPTPPIAWPV